jgi:hypothetical protein
MIITFSIASKPSAFSGQLFSVPAEHRTDSDPVQPDDKKSFPFLSGITLAVETPF